ncbi:MAG: hypothetical protein GXZ03_10050 [Proteiniphilum sp.]|nr:hypothetical protein [Proteiniphilum sp.]
MTKSFRSFAWGASSFNVEVIKKQPVKVPTKNKKPDYSVMESLISAVQKLVIKDVVLYADKKIAATKNIVREEYD